MMGFRPSFFLFFAVAAAELFPFEAAAPDASGGLGLAVSLSCCEPFMADVGPASSGGDAMRAVGARRHRSRSLSRAWLSCRVV